MAELRQLLEQAVPAHDAEVPLGEIRRRSRRRTAARVSGIATLVVAALVTVMTVTLPSPESPPVVGEPDPDRPTAPDGQVPLQERDPRTVKVGATGMTWHDYLAQLTLVLRTVHPHGDVVDWDAAHERLAVDEVDSDSDGYRAATALVAALGDRHTRFIDALTWNRISGQDTTGGPDAPSGQLLDGRVGYVALPSTAGQGPVVDDYARTARGILQQSAEACGWIVDLRRNGGGDPWVIMQGIAPLLGEGHVLTAVGPSGTFQATIEDGELLLDGLPPDQWAERPLEPIHGAEGLVVGHTSRPDPDSDRYGIPEASSTDTIDGDIPVAVLHDEETFSAAELTTIAMYGRPGPLRTFGSTTAGFTTAVTGYELVDGSRLHLTTHILGDRTGNSYEQALEPDVATDAPLDEAREWLTGRPACRP